MKKKSLNVSKTLVICILMILIFININTTIGINSIQKSDYTQLYNPHDPIYIVGNDEFTSENGVTGGSGYYNDPFIIENWEIDSSSKNGIVIRNVTSYFKIQNCYIFGGGNSHDGIVFINVTHGEIKDSLITGNRYGIIFRTQYPGNENSSFNKINNNNINNNLRDGIHFEHTVWGHHSYNHIFQNKISNNNQGIYLIMSANNQIFSNNIVSNIDWGVNLTMCMGGGRHNKVYHNNFFDNGKGNGQGCVWWTLENDWDNGYPSGGNYWNDYTGEDSNGDGIGDEPYEIYYFGQYYYYDKEYDYYPLMEPYGDNLSPFAEFTWNPYYPEPGENILFNASDSWDYDGYITLFQWDWDNDGYYDESSTSPLANYTFEEGGNHYVTLQVHDNSSKTDSTTKIVEVKTYNQPPKKPNIDGPTTGKAGIECCWTFQAKDTDGDDIFYLIDWGDGITTYWLGPNHSGERVEVCHTYEKTGQFNIKAKAKDIYGNEGEWSDPFPINIPRNRAIKDFCFQWLLEYFPILERLLGLIRMR